MVDYARVTDLGRAANDGAHNWREIEFQERDDELGETNEKCTLV